MRGFRRHAQQLFAGSRERKQRRLIKSDKCSAAQHKGDEANSFGVFENVNLAYQPQFAATVLSLREELHSNWRTAL